jgi:hypothetical protein
MTKLCSDWLSGIFPTPILFPVGTGFASQQYAPLLSPQQASIPENSSIEVLNQQPEPHQFSGFDISVVGKIKKG